MDIQNVKEKLYAIEPVEKLAVATHHAILRPLLKELHELWPAEMNLREDEGVPDARAADAGVAHIVFGKFLAALGAYEREIVAMRLVGHKTALADDAMRLNRAAARWFHAQSPQAKQELRQMMDQADPLFLNRSLFGKTRGIVFSHNFSPSLDPAALVSTKRIRQMQAAFPEGVSWDVISQDMSSNTKTDFLFDKLYGQFCSSTHSIVDYMNCNVERVAVEWGRRAVLPVVDEEYDVCYSHALMPASLVAGRRYKQLHPDTLWIAEIGDPIYMFPDGKPKQPCENYICEEEYLNTFWHDIEANTMREADVIIFNNTGLRDLVLSCTRDREAARLAEDKVVIMHNCCIDPRCLKLVDAPVALANDRINVAYLGSITETRPFEPLERVLDNPNVELYLYLTMNWTTIPTFEALPKEARDRIHYCKPVTHLEALNVCSKMDYLMVNDTLFPYEPNPYQPSKYFDYTSTGRPIIAFTQVNSPIDKDTYPSLHRVHNAEEMHELAMTLQKQA